MISQFLNKPLSDELLNRITEQCTFNGMMKNLKSYLLCGTEAGAKFLRKGVVETGRITLLQSKVRDLTRNC